MTGANAQNSRKNELMKKVGNMTQLAYARPCCFHDGKSDGVKAFDVSTGSGLEFTVLEGKCLDIYDLKYKGVNMSFISKPGLSASPYFDLHGREFFRYFQAGMLYTCGLSNIGIACSDQGEDYNFHGRISQTPAENVSLKSGWTGDDYVMEIKGEMREASHYKENLVLHRSITTKYGAKSVVISDTVENQSFEEQPVMLLYHFNLGYPLLDKGARVIMPCLVTIPRTDIAQKGLSQYADISDPVDSFKEHVFYHTNASDEEGNSYAGLINDKLSLGLYIKYNTNQLPFLAEWKSMAPGDYALGLEAGNHLLEGRDVERAKGTLIHLAPFEKMRFDLELVVLDGVEEINAFEDKIRALKTP